ncbi:MAG TPA: SprT-like domain-containing protein [Gemmataceae bacterium]|nr:SprT-like domain-containing protein [Gemmataceae bacterium]
MDKTGASKEMGAVYSALRQHQVTENWVSRDLVADLQRWADLFNLEFKLNIPELSLSVDWLPRRRLGHFRYGHNGFGLRGEVVINRRYLDRREYWQVLGTLLHELLHAWQQAHGKPGKRNHHNKQFREKASEFGLVIDHRGFTKYESPSQFTELLQRHGINVPTLPEVEVTNQRGSSKLKKWSCGCTNVRVAVREFNAQCLNCGNLFCLQ